MYEQTDKKENKINIFQIILKMSNWKINWLKNYTILSSKNKTLLRNDTIKVYKIIFLVKIFSGQTMYEREQIK